MKVEEVQEHEDGSATVELSDISKEELQMLIQEGFIAILKRSIEEEQKKRQTAALFQPKNDYFKSDE